MGAGGAPKLVTAQSHDQPSLARRSGVPKILALMPAYDPAPVDFARSLGSLLNQTIAMDVCIIDDGSASPVSELCPADSRIILVRLDRNAGITAALRAGIEIGLEGGYDYFCRLDVGDLAYPHRVATQLDHMESHPEIDLLGARSRVLDHEGSLLSIRGTLGGPEGVRRQLWKNFAFHHSTFFIRAAAIRRLGNYDATFSVAQDYEMAQRFAARGGVDCLDETLIDYVADPRGISETRSRVQLRMRLKSQLKHAAPTTPAWYLGVARTLVLFGVPRQWLRRTAANLKRLTARKSQS